jgi:Zinc finger, C2H2 type
MCTDCSDIFCSFEVIRSHIVRLHFNDRKKPKGINPPKYPCLLCPVQRHAKMMPRHLVKAHKIPVVFVCPTCGKQFNDAGDQERHIKDDRWETYYCNDGSKSTCHVCGKTFKQREMLWLHSFDHRGFKP